MDTKTCTKCNETRSVNEFHKSKAAKDGLYAYCRPCGKEVKKQRLAAYKAVNQLLTPDQIRAKTPTKKCSACKDTLPSSEFGINHNNKSGLQSQCYECDAASSRNYKERNPDQARKHREANPDMYKAHDQKRRALKYEAFVENVLLKDLVERDGSYCSWCGEDSDEWHVDHIVPLTKDGLHCLDNLAVACPPCNISKRDKIPALFVARRIRLGLPIKLTPHVQQLIADLEAGTSLEMYQKIDGEIRHPRYVHESTHAAVAA